MKPLSSIDLIKLRSGHSKYIKASELSGETGYWVFSLEQSNLNMGPFQKITESAW